MKGYSVKLPLRYDLEDGPYQMNKNLKDVVKQNLKMLLLTNPGERIMNPDYGIGVKRLLFENRTETASSIDYRLIIESQLKKYLPFILVDSFEIFDDTPENLNSIAIQLVYNIPSIKEKDAISLILNNTNV